MENKIQELTDKIYREGVDKANTEADSILSKANQEKDSIIQDAQKKADTIVENAKKQAAELIENAKSEIKLFGGQAVNALKSEVTDLLVNQTIIDTVKKATTDSDFLNQFILQIAKGWTQNEPVLISTADAKSLTEYFSVHAKDLLDKGVTIEQVNGIKTHFSISPADGSYKMNFGDEEFINYFKAFLRPKLITMLFEE